MTQELFEKLLTDKKWDIWVLWVRTDEPQFRLSKDGVNFGKPLKQNEMTKKLKTELRNHGYVTEQDLRGYGVERAIYTQG